MIFDTWGGVLSKQNYLDFSLNYMAKIVKSVKAQHPTIPITLFMTCIAFELR
jgi:uroporphyrinogen decarboxylase